MLRSSKAKPFPVWDRIAFEREFNELFNRFLNMGVGDSVTFNEPAWKPVIRSIAQRAKWIVSIKTVIPFTEWIVRRLK